MSHRIEFSPEALGDLIDLYDYIARIEDCCRNLSVFPDCGVRRDDLRPGLRIVGFERRAVIAFQITSDAVTILRIVYGGRDLQIVFP